jgi:hypothetical protein
MLVQKSSVFEDFKEQKRIMRIEGYLKDDDLRRKVLSLKTAISLKHTL